MSMAPIISASGACLCGGVNYAVVGPLRPVVYCHCEQCRKTSGHYVATTACSLEHLIILGNASLRWFRSSAEAQRGFCTICGASMFWRPDHGKYVSIMAGTIDKPTGLKAVEHLFVPDATDYYSIRDGLPQHAERGLVNLIPTSR